MVYEANLFHFQPDVMYAYRSAKLRGVYALVYKIRTFETEKHAEQTEKHTDANRYGHCLAH